MKIRKITAILLTMVLFVSLLAINAFAAVNETLGVPVVSGSYDEATGDITLTWEPVEGAAYYMVHGCLLEEIEWNLQDLGETSETSFVYTEGVPGNTYCFVVTAWDAEGNVSPENSNEVIVECTIPEPDPVPLSAPVVKASNDPASGKIKLTWDAVEGAVSYKVYRSTSKNGSYSLMKTVRTGTEFTNLNAVPGKYYYYKVKAIAADTALNSEFSAIVGRTCDLAAPVITTGNDTATGKTTVSWDPVEGAVKYQVYRSTTKNGSYTLMKTVSGTEYTNLNAVAGKLYYYKAKAIHSNTSANSAFSNIASRTCDLAQPVVSLKNTSTSSIEISWAKVANAVSYKIYHSESKSGTYKLIKTTTDLSFNNTGLTVGKTYYYKVRAIHSNTNAHSVYSKISSAKVLPMAPTLKKSATVTSDSIKISWNEVPGASGYYVYRRVSTSDSWTRVATITSGSTTEFKNTDLSAGRYYYSVAAYETINGTKYTSVKSTGIRCRTLTKPTISVEAGGTSLVNTISWNKRTGATGYQVYYRIGKDGSWQRAATLDSSTLSYDHKVELGKYYYYKVRAIYKYSGVTSYGAYSAVSESMLWYDAPELNYDMDGNSENGVALAVIAIENRGDKPVRFYAADGKWEDPYNSYYDCDLILIDYESAVDGEIVEVNYVAIAPGDIGFVTVLADTDYGRYVDGTTIHLEMRYGGVYFDTEINSTSFTWDLQQ